MELQPIRFIFHNVCMLLFIVSMFHSCNVIDAFPETKTSLKEAQNQQTQQQHWALLVAGSNSWMNYRHQADVCHAYHVVRKHGIPDDRIVVMMYDDIANNSRNPFPGEIINRPNGPNLYPGVLKDYTGNEVTPEVFLKVLSGNQAGVEKLIGRKGGKVIKSGPNDTVFVYFSDHGGPGVLSFPGNETYSPVLHAKQLNTVLENMHRAGRYKEMVMYIEACFAGSMFKEFLSKDINVMVSTAANAEEHSYSCYFDRKRFTPLGDVFSINWLQDSDAESVSTETLLKQFTILRQKTKRSHVTMYGNSSIAGTSFVGEFQGNQKLLQLKKVGHHNNTGSRMNNDHDIDPNMDAIRADEVDLFILKEKLTSSNDIGEQKSYKSQITQLLNRRAETKNVFKEIVHYYYYTNTMHLNTKHSLSSKYYNTLLNTVVQFSDRNVDCYMQSVDLLAKVCPGLKLSNNYLALEHLKVLANLCHDTTTRFKEKMESVRVAIETASLNCSICAI